MVYEILSSMILPLLIATAAGVSTDMPSSELSYVTHDTSIIQVQNQTARSTGDTWYQDLENHLSLVRLMSNR